MAVSEPERHEFYTAMEGLIGKKKAETMMSLLPPTGWGDVATRQDLQAHQVATRQDLRAHQVATRQDLRAHQVATRQALQAHRAETKRDFEILESRINERILRTALMVNIPSILAAVALSFAAVRLG